MAEIAAIALACAACLLLGWAARDRWLARQRHMEADAVEGTDDEE